MWQSLYWLQVVLAYLMAMERIGVEAALASLKQTYPYACPNAGVASTPTIHSATEGAAPSQYPV